MKKITALFLMVLLFMGGGPIAAWGLESGGTQPGLQLTSSNKLYDATQLRMNGLDQYFEIVVSGDSATIADFIVYDNSYGENLPSVTNATVTIERITAVKETVYNTERYTENKEKIASFPLSAYYVGQTVNEIWEYEVDEYVLGALGANYPLAPGVYGITIGPYEAFLSNYSTISCYLTGFAGNIQEFDPYMTTDSRVNVLRIMGESGVSFEEAKEKESWEWAINTSAALEKARQEEAAKKAQEAAALAAKPITLNVDGKTIKTDSPPVIVDGRTLVPARALVEALGRHTVEWNAEDQEVYIYNTFTDELVIELKINSTQAWVLTWSGDWPDMRPAYLDVPAQIINGRTMIPVRFVAERLGCSATWDPDTKTVFIVS